MALYNSFAESQNLISPYTLDGIGKMALMQLGGEGFVVTTGLRAEDIADITKIAEQPAVREYCPNDLTTRFGSTNMANEWLRTKGGRHVFLLHDQDDETLAGYGWTGIESQSLLPRCKNTFAVRLSGHHAGRGLGKLFTDVIISGSVAEGITDIGLETWQSNTAAVHIYEKAGAEHVTDVESKRLTLLGNGGIVGDVRLFMEFSRTMAK